MRLALADLLCQSCNGYVHPFFDRCPGCSAHRPSRYAEVLHGADLGAADMAADPAVIEAATSTIYTTVTLNSLHGARSRGRLQPEPDVAGRVDAAQMIDFVGGQLTYRAFGALGDPATSIDARIRAAAGALVLSTTVGGRTLASVPAATILGASPSSGKTQGAPPWDGTWIEGARMSTTPGVPRGDLLVTYASDRAAGSFSIANPSGLFASRARRDHYEELARWIGLLAIVRAEARWQEIGVAAYAAETGLVPAAELDVNMGRADTTRREGRTTTAARGAPSTAREALLELEELRTAGLITQAEYDVKRREILQRI